MFPDFKYEYSTQVEIIVQGQPSPGNQQGKVFFPDLPLIRPDTAIIKGIELITVGTQSVSPSSGTSLLNISTMQQAGLTIYGAQNFVKGGRLVRSNSFEMYQNIPLVRFNTMINNAGDPYSPFVFDTQNAAVDWSKSYVQIVSGVFGNTENACIPFVVYYDLISNRIL